MCILSQCVLLLGWVQAERHPGGTELREETQTEVALLCLLFSAVHCFNTVFHSTYYYIPYTDVKSYI